MRYIELFAGVGGFRLGIERAFNSRPPGQNQEISSMAQSSINTTGEHSWERADCVFANEWDKYAAQTYNKNFGGHIDTRDITTIPTGDIPDHDLLVGGFPCQTFSVAGKGAGFDDTRGTMFFEIARILKDKQPRHLVLENVKGLLSHDSGRTFQTILKVLADLGYRVEWQVLNSKDFGVPQNRERVFIVGHLGTCCGRKVFPIGANGEQNTEPGKPVFSTIRASYPGNWNGDYLDTDTVYGQEEVKRQPLRFLDRNQKNIEGDYSFTVDSSNTGGVRTADRIRRLTPLECERLQGFPDGHTEGVSDTQRYKQMGNAVTVNVVEAVMRRLYEPDQQ